MCVNMFLLIAAMTALGATDPAMGVDRQQRELSYTYIPSVTAVPPDVVNRCSSFDLASMSKGRTCGSPYASPCFDFSRCLDRATIYVYDPQVMCNDRHADKILLLVGTVVHRVCHVEPKAH